MTTRFLALALAVLVAGAMGAGLARANDIGGGSVTRAEVAPVSTFHLEAEPAFLTLLNFDESSHRVRLETLNAGGLAFSVEFHQVSAYEALTLSLPLTTDLVTYRTSCTGCATSMFGLAAGQRVLIFIDDPGSDLTARSDLRIFNEGDFIVQGIVRTGSNLGRGRTLLPFDLVPGEEAVVGLRLKPGATIELNLTCLGCTPQRILLGNGIDLEVPLR